MRSASNLLEALGLLAVIAGTYLFDWRAAVIVAGVLAVLLGLVLDPPRRLE